MAIERPPEAQNRSIPVPKSTMPQRRARLVVPQRLTARFATALAVSCALLVTALSAFAPTATAATTTDCTLWGTTSINGGAYIYQQNEWNSSTQQCAAIDTSTGAFSLTTANFNLSTSGPPATYPSIYKGCHWGACTSNSGLPIKVSALGTATTSWSTTQPASGAYDVAYDLWFNSTPTTIGQPDGTEVMIWLNSRGGVQPFGSKTASAGIAGKQWDVWTGQQSSWKIISYVLTPGATSFANLDVKALISDAVARGSINPANYLIDAEAGFEVWQGGQGLASNSFSFDATSGGSTTPPTTAPPTTAPPTTAPPTTAPPTTPATGTKACSATFTVGSTWSSGFTGTVRVTAGSAAISRWTVGLTLPSGTSITNLWNGQLSGSTVSSASYNGAVPAGGSVEFGFQGTGSANGVAASGCTAG
jgi:hypothetical protein